MRTRLLRLPAIVPHVDTTKAFRCAQVNATDQHWTELLFAQGLMSHLPERHNCAIGTEANRRRYSILSRDVGP